MPSVLRTAQANIDLVEIWEYIARDTAPSADELLDRIAEACGTLADNPLVGRAREELAPSLRSLPVGNYVIFYRPIHDGIVVIRVLHGARDLPGLF